MDEGVNDVILSRNSVTVLGISCGIFEFEPDYSENLLSL